jgi:endonuclease G
MEFTEDMDGAYPRATDDDYYNARYDRGHMCPSGDNKWDRRAQMQSFLFSNICPQNHWLNKGDWNDLEIQCRYWARSIGDIYIVTGPIFYNGVRNTIGKNKVAVPDAFFKVILDDRGKSKAIGFVYPNNGKHKKMTDCIRSVDEVEKLTGIDFFPRLDDKVENIIEAASVETMNQEWQVYKARSRGNTGK